MPKYRLNVIASATNLGDTPKMEALLGPLTEIFQRYEKHELDRIHMVYSRFCQHNAPRAAYGSFAAYR